jgi:methionyl-tRNA synthetase
MAEEYSQLATLLGMPIYLIVLFLIWSVIWKGLALWKAARKKHTAWFVILLIVNTMGFLEILYIFLFADLFSKKKENKVAKKKKK